CAVFIGAPLWWQARRAARGAKPPAAALVAAPGPAQPAFGASAIAYFACLGTGYMLLEIGFTQRFVLFLGHPVHALTVILFTLLVGGGMGSALSRRFGSRPERVVLWAAPCAALLGVLYASLLPRLFQAWLAYGRPARIGLSVALLLPISIVLGMPLPAGVRL